MNLKLLANKVFSRVEHETPVKHLCEQGQKKVFHSESEMKHPMKAEKPEPVPFHIDGREFDLGGSDNVKAPFEPAHSDPTTQRVLIAAWWLEDNLAKPRRIGEIFAQWGGGEQRLQRNGSLRWEGGRDGENDHWGADLCKARELLGIEAFIGADGLMWWTCPKRSSWDLMMTLPAGECLALAQRYAA